MFKLTKKMMMLMTLLGLATSYVSADDSDVNADQSVMMSDEMPTDDGAMSTTVADDAMGATVADDGMSTDEAAVADDSSAMDMTADAADQSEDSTTSVDELAPADELPTNDDGLDNDGSSMDYSAAE